MLFANLSTSTLEVATCHDASPLRCCVLMAKFSAPEGAASLFIVYSIPQRLHFRKLEVVKACHKLYFGFRITHIVSRQCCCRKVGAATQTCTLALLRGVRQMGKTGCSTLWSGQA